MADTDDVQDVQDEQVIEGQDEQQDGETPPEGEQDKEASEDEHVVISIGDAPPAPEEDAAKAPQWVRDLRISDREKAKKIRELEEKLQAATVGAKPAEPAKKPTLAECDYDEETYESKLTAWHEQQSAVREAAKEKERAEQKANDEWQAQVDTYNKEKTALKVPDYEDAEATAVEILSVTQRGIIVSGAKNSATVMYALGKNPAKAKELASINNPVKFAFAVAELESKLKVTPRKAPPAPERQVHGTTSVAIGAGDAELERLRADAAKTGDMSKVHAYKKSKRAA